MAEFVSVALILVDKVPALLTFLKKELNQDRNAALLHDVNKLTGHLTMFQDFLQDVEIHENASSIGKHLIRKVRDVTHEMEDVLDLFKVHAPRDFSKTAFIQKGYIVCHDLKHCIPVHGIQSKITSIDASVSEIKKLTEYNELLKRTVNPTQPHPNTPTGERQEYFKKALQKITAVIKRLNGSNNHSPREERDNEITSIKTSEESLVKLLTSSRSGTTISVVGPTGTGKTVLVSRAYKSKMVIEQFDCHAWLSLSHADNHEQRLKNLLSQFFGLRINELHSPLGADIVTKMENYLGGKRYLVVLDGIRKYEEWASIKQLLPDRSNGSRMIITTQDEGVALRCASSNENIFRVKKLEWNDSWKLFCKKAYGNEKCPDDLLELSKMIVERCQGLPQPILALGTVLSRKPRRYDEWSRVHANCINAMFLPSYYDLHINQKSCLLYFSLFPEDYSIKRERLIRLWLSEGFINEPETHKGAEDILNELISRNLVDAASRDFRGRVKSCRVLNLKREFICQKSKEMKFAAIATANDMYGTEGHRYRRLSIVNASSGLRRMGGLHLDSVRSLFMFGPETMSSNMIAETLKRISFLKVLDLENAHLDSFPRYILDAVLLRYLSLRNTNVNEVPKTIERLRYLEYLDLKQTQVNWLPEEVFSLDKLKHLLVSYRYSPMSNEDFDRLQGVQIIGAMRGWSSIQKLSIIKIDNNPGFFKMLRQLTRLTKLGLNNLRAKDGPLLCSCIVNMQHLSTLDLTWSMEEKLDLDHMDTFPSSLQHLYLKGRLTILPKWIPFLHGLVKLLLRGSKLSDSPVENLQHLPNLVELEMTDAFTGKMLLFHNTGFPKLRTLYIEQFDRLETIEVHNGGMPILRKLSISKCLQLCDLPSGIERLKALEEFMLYNMPQHFTCKLDKTSKERRRIKHVPIIKSYGSAESSRWELRNFS